MTTPPAQLFAGGKKFAFIIAHNLKNNSTKEDTRV